MTIYKYPLSNFVNVVEMPKNAVILSCGLDPQLKLCIWAIVNPKESLEKRNIYTAGTGWPIDSLMDKNVDFIGTVTDGPDVWHIFAEKNK